MYEITVEKIFTASHAIRLSDTEVEPLHSHNWPVKVTVATKTLNEIQTVIDFHLLEAFVSAATDKLDRKNINEIAPFGVEPDQINPTAERIAQWIGEQVAQHLPAGVHLASVCIGEAPGCWATWRP